MSGIYIHIPFCKQACYYCDFHFSTSVKRKGDMLDSIAKELVLRKDDIQDEVETVYFGGGTPSLLSIGEIDRILALIAEHYKLTKEPEITLEANPDDLTETKVQELAASSVNRLSIGVQSFFDKDLQYMNRAHHAGQAKSSLKYATEYFKNISVDLIYGIPNLSEERWKENLQVIFELDIPHISSYALTVEPKTALDHFIRSGKYQAPDDAVSRNHFKILQDTTHKHGYMQYEVSNFGKEGYYSKHNGSYWKGVSYLGIGPSAHSYDGIYRSWNVANNAKYMAAINKGVLPSEKELLCVEDRINESIMTGLRTMWGVSLNEIEKLYGEKFKKEILDNARKYLKADTLLLENNQLFLKSDNYFLADGISADLFLLKV